MSRLIIVVITTILEEAALAAIVLIGLPLLNVELPMWGLGILMAAFLAYSVVSYRAGSAALRRKGVGGLTDMLGTVGKVESPLTPHGFIRIKGELWEADSEAGRISPGEEVVVTAQSGLKLMVRRVGNADPAHPTTR